MGVHDAPQWLLSAWVHACIGAGATASHEEIENVGTRLIDRWDGPGRHFHNVRHLVDVLMRVDELAEEAHEPDLVRLAAWYHGAIFSAADVAAYAQKGGEDEAASAQLARKELIGLGIPEDRADRVHHLVTALAHHSPAPGDLDCIVLCDADLSVLASEPQRYKAYLAEVREEYAHLPAEDYLRARIAILTKLCDRATMFGSPHGANWEEAARQNVGAELHRSVKELAEIERTRAEAEPAATAEAAATEAAATAAADDDGWPAGSPDGSPDDSSGPQPRA